MGKMKKIHFKSLIKFLCFTMLISGVLFLSGCFGGSSNGNNTTDDKPSTSDKDDDCIDVKGVTYIFVRTIAPTCIEGGYDIYEDIDKKHPCIYRNKKEALGHDYDEDNPHCEWIEDNDLLHANVLLKCKRCDHIIGVSSYVESKVVTAATCTSKGVKETKAFYKRGIDDLVPADNVLTTEIPMISHTPVSGHDGVEATCTQTGFTDSIICSVCNTLITERKVIPEAHIEIENNDGVRATCTQIGYTASTSCSLCGKILSARTPIPTIDHDYISNHDGVAATCTKSGFSDSYSCSVCGFKKEREVIAQIPHNAVSDNNGQAPTCSEIGYTDSTHCEYCGITLSSREILEKAPHNPIVWQEEVPATCVASGYTSSSSCATCGIVLTERKEIPAKGHSFIDVDALEATCTTDGHTAFNKCETCGLIQKESTIIPALGHIIVNDAKIEPTCINKGREEGSHCSRCGEIQSGCKEIDALGHDIVSGDCKADCLNPGFKNRTYCKRCNIIIKNGEEIPALGHNFSDDSIFCQNKCGTSNPTFKEVSTAQELILALSSAEKSKILLTSDIDYGGNEWSPIDEWNGNLYGNGHKIYNFMLSSVTPGENYGLIRINNGVIDNVVITDFTFTYKANVNGNSGVVCGKNENIIRQVVVSDAKLSYSVTNLSTNLGVVSGLNNGTIENCKVLNSISIIGDNYATSSSTIKLGMITGENAKLVKECESKGRIETSSHHYAARHWDGGGGKVYAEVGGLVGQVSEGAEVNSCLSQVKIKTSSVQENDESYNWENQIYVGGLVGVNYGLLKSSYVSDVTINTSAYKMVRTGGFVGYNRTNATIESCYSHANVYCERSTTYGGGFVGENEAAIRNSYCTGNVINKASNSLIAGFVGHNTSTGTLFKNYSTGNVDTIGGSAGFFIAKVEGTVYKCYYVNSATLLKDNVYVTESENENVVSLPAQTLYSEEFLINELAWDKNGWIILTDDNPMIETEFNNGHNFKTEIFLPDCENYGFTVYHCNDCNLIVIRDFVEALGHLYETDPSKGETTAPTCTSDGFTKFYCTRKTLSGESCTSYKIDNIVAKLDHPQRKVEKFPNCEEDGYYHCETCNNNIVIPKTGHKLVEIENDNNKQATCKDEGIQWYKCENEKCNHIESVILSKTGHKYSFVTEVAPTHSIIKNDDNTFDVEFIDGCTSGYRCSVCGDIFSGCKIVCSHTYIDKVTKEPTCSSLGELISICSVCEAAGYKGEGYKLVKDIPMVDHKDSNHDYVCDVCNKNLLSENSDSFLPVATVDDLREIANQPSFNYKLTADIDLSNVDWKPICDEGNSFKGTFYGNGFVIKGLHCNLTSSTNEQVFGLFKVNEGTIINLCLDSPTFNVSDTKAIVGGIAVINKGAIIDCSIKNGLTVVVKAYLTLDNNQFNSGNYVLSNQLEVTIGGLVGRNEVNALVDKCSILGTQNVEAIVFANLTASVNLRNIGIYNSKAKVEMNLTLNYGGIVGYNKGTVSNSNAMDGNSGIGIAVISRLSTFMGKAYSKLNLYANAICGNNGNGNDEDAAGKLLDNNYSEFKRYDNCQSAEELVEGLVGRFLTYAKKNASFLNGRLYTIESNIVDHIND